jgi:tetratricopeptide (TPR) repeat protein
MLFPAQLRRPLPGLAGLLLVLASCSALQKPKPAPVAPPPPVQAAVPSPHLQHAVELLKAGKAQAADAELHAYLNAFPESREAKYLIAQIETPIAKLYPSDSFTVPLAKGESLLTLARTYLNNPLSFYGLARFNNIGVPNKVAHGRLVRIPKTPEALAALANRAAKPETPVPAVQPAPVAASPEAAPASAGDQHALAEDWYRRGLIAFQRQDLDGAIADWDKTLAIEPDNKEAQLNRAQAVRLRSNLAKLKKKSANP